MTKEEIEVFFGQLDSMSKESRQVFITLKSRLVACLIILNSVEVAYADGPVKMDFETLLSMK